MKPTAQEEYGLRCAIQVARRHDRIITIPEIAAAEGITVPYAAKMMRLLLKGGIVKSTRGHQGGYRLSAPPAEITVAAVMDALGPGIFPAGFCVDHSGVRHACIHTSGCAIRSVWSALDAIIRDALERISLSDLIGAGNRANPLAALRLDRLQPGGAGPAR
jgi:Rrf2 family protein